MPFLEGKTLWQFINDLLIPNQTVRYWHNKDGELMDIVNQLVCSIHCFHHYGIQHNDLHLGNVFVLNINSAVLNFITEENKISIRAKNQIRIIDWDRGFSTMVDWKKYEKITLFARRDEYGTSANKDSMDPRRDLFTVLCNMHANCLQFFKHNSDELKRNLPRFKQFIEENLKLWTLNTEPEKGFNFGKPEKWRLKNKEDPRKGGHGCVLPIQRHPDVGHIRDLVFKFSDGAETLVCMLHYLKKK